MDTETFAAWAKKSKQFIADGFGTGGLIPVIATTLAAHGFFWATVGFMYRWTDGWYLARHPAELKRPDRCMVDVSAETCDRLFEYLTLAESRAHLHYEVGRMLQVWEFGFLGTAYWAGTLTAMMAFVAMKRGYDDLGAWGKGALIGLICATAFFGGLPQLVSLDQNIEENIDAYNSYDGISNEVRSYMKSGQAISGNHVDGASFLHKVDAMIASTPATRLQFDAEQVNLGQSRFMELSQQIESTGAEPAQ